MFGLATLQMAQSLRAHISSVRLGGPGLQIPDATSSCLTYSSSHSAVTNTRTRTGTSSSASSGSGSSGGTGSGAGSVSVVAEVPTGKRQNAAEHTFAWRDFLDIIVRWRQVRLTAIACYVMLCYVMLCRVALFASSNAPPCSNHRVEWSSMVPSFFFFFLHHLYLFLPPFFFFLLTLPIPHVKSLSSYQVTTVLPFSSLSLCFPSYFSSHFTSLIHVTLNLMLLLFNLSHVLLSPLIHSFLFLFHSMNRLN